MKVNTVAARLPGVVCKVEVEVGDLVEKGQVLVVLESMKMEIAVQAPVAGTIRAVRVRESTSVQSGTPLVDLASIV